MAIESHTLFCRFLSAHISESFYRVGGAIKISFRGDAFIEPPHPPRNLKHQGSVETAVFKLICGVIKIYIAVKRKTVLIELLYAVIVVDVGTDESVTEERHIMPAAAETRLVSLVQTEADVRDILEFFKCPRNIGKHSSVFKCNGYSLLCTSYEKYEPFTRGVRIFLYYGFLWNKD